MAIKKEDKGDCIFYDYSRGRCTLKGMDCKKVKCCGKVDDCEAVDWKRMENQTSKS